MKTCRRLNFKMDVDDRPIHVCVKGVRQLIEYKKKLGRDVDLLDVAYLEKMKESSLQWT